MDQVDNKSETERAVWRRNDKVGLDTQELDSYPIGSMESTSDETATSEFHALCKTASEATPRTAANSQTTTATVSFGPGVAAASSSPDSWEPVIGTTDIFSRMDDLSLQWSLHSTKDDASFLNDDFDVSSFSTMHSASFVTEYLPTSIGGCEGERISVVGGPAGDCSSGKRRPYRPVGYSGDSVFDRLYSHAKAKAKADAARSLHFNAPSANHSFGGSTLSSRSLPSNNNGESPAFERLYQLSKKKASLPTRTVEPLSAAESLERRLNYEPPEKVNVSPRHKSHAGTWSVASAPPSHGKASTASLASTRKARTVKPLSAAESLERRLNYAPPGKTNLSPRHRSRTASSTASLPSGSRSTRRTGTPSVSSTKTGSVKSLSPTESLHRRLNYRPPASVNVTPRRRNQQAVSAIPGEKSTRSSVSSASRSTTKTSSKRPFSASESRQRRLGCKPPATVNVPQRREPLGGASSVASRSSGRKPSRSVASSHSTASTKSLSAAESLQRRLNYRPPDSVSISRRPRTSASKASAKVQDASLCSGPATETETTRVPAEYCERQALLIQRSWRSVKARRVFTGHKTCAVLIQSCWRRFQAQSLLDDDCTCPIRTVDDAHCFLSALRIQTEWRAFHCRKSYVTLHAGVCRMQAHVRASCLERRYRGMRLCALVIQRTYKSHRVRIMMQVGGNGAILGELSQKHRHDYAAILLQSLWRASAARSEYDVLRRSAVVLQSCVARPGQVSVSESKLDSPFSRSAVWQKYANFASVKELRQLAVVIIQAHARASLYRTLFRRKRSAVTTIQSVARGRRARSALLLSLHRSAVRIQAPVRGILVRLAYAKINASCLKIQRLLRKQWKLVERRDATMCVQRNWRASSCRSVYRNSRVSASRVQATVRAFLYQKRFDRMRLACVLLQSVARGLTIRRRALLYHDAAVSIQKFQSDSIRRLNLFVRLQAAVRGHLERQHFRCMRSASIRLQALIRGSKIRQRALLYNKAAVLVQRCFRGARSRSDYSVRRISIVIFQAAVRGHLCRQRFVRMRSASTLLQVAVRGWKRRRQHSSEYSVRRVSVVLVQAALRGHVERERYIRARSVSIRLQSAVRGYKIRQRGMLNYEAAIVIQRCFRGARSRLDSRGRHISIVMVQAAVRGHLDRQRFLRTCTASAKLQTVVRGQRIRRRALLFHLGAISIQMHARRFIYRLKYLRYRSAALAIQKAVHRSHERRRYTEMDTACIRIQTAARRRMVRIHFAASQDSATCIQRYWRGTLRRSIYSDQKVSVLIIQAAARGNLARALYETTQLLVLQHGAASRIQRLWWGYQERIVRAADRRVSIVIIQAGIRGKLARGRCYEMEAIRRREDAGGRIQRCWRGFQCRMIYIDRRASVLIVQAAMRGKLARNRRYVEMEVMGDREDAGGRIQRCWRGYQCRIIYADRRVSVLTIQAVMRGKLARSLCLKAEATRRREEVAGQIQRCWRGCQCRMMCIVRRVSVLRIQALMRGKIVRSRYFEAEAARYRERAMGRIQRSWRGYQCRSVYADCRSSSLMIQAAMRGKLARSHFAKMQVACVRLQALGRCCVAKVHTESLRAARAHTKSVHEAALTIQRSWRKHECRMSFVDLRTYIVMVQATTRGWISQRRLSNMRSACLQIQSLVRHRSARLQNVSRIGAATCLQSNWRKVEARQAFANARVAVIAIQTAGRCRVSRREYLATQVSCLLVQSLVRRQVARLRTKELHANAACIQSAWRSAQSRRAFSSLLASVSIVQALFRGKLARNRFAGISAAAIRIRSWARSQHVRRLVLSSITASTEIQKHWRGKIQRTVYRKHQRAQQQRMREAHANQLWACVQIQAATRGHKTRDVMRARTVAAVSIQKFWRGAVTRLSFVALDTSAVVLQSFLRGCQARVDARANRKTQSPYNRAAVKLQALFRRLPRQVRFVEQRAAARMIQQAFFVWKMELDLLRLDSSVVLLRRILKGDLGRMATMFALLQINSALSSRWLSSFSRIVFASEAPSAVSLAYDWDQAMTNAMDCTSILIQRKFRRYRSQAPLDVRLEKRRIRERAAVLIQLSFRCFSLRRETSSESATTLQQWWKANRQKPVAPLRSPVAVKVIQQLDEKRVLVQLCPTTFATQDRAVRVLQASARKIYRRKKRLEEHETVRLVARVERSAQDQVHELLTTTGSLLELQGPCIARLAEKVRQLQTSTELFACKAMTSTPSQHATAENQDATLILSDAKCCLVPNTPSSSDQKKVGMNHGALFDGSGAETFLSPIKPIADGWNRLD